VSVNVGGRPRIHDRDQIEIELFEWLKKPDSINLCGFCADHDPMLDPGTITKWCIGDPDGFGKSIRKARAKLADRREKLLSENKLHPKAYDLNAPVYDHFLKQEKREEKEFEASLKDGKNEEMDGKLSSILTKLDTIESAKDFDKQSK